MTAPIPDRADTPLFAAHIRPHRSLGRKGVCLVLTLVAIAGVISSIPFIVAGAWPVAGYFGLDVLLLFVAFRANIRAAEECEEVRLTYVELLLRRIGGRRRAAEWRFNPAWVKLERRHDADYGLQRLALISGPTRLVIARPLSPAERADFADAFEASLIEARRGPRFGD
ncbi:MAG: DUF2244 domain-containing protein [Beijerinckiaceae bacterium]